MSDNTEPNRGSRSTLCSDSKALLAMVVISLMLWAFALFACSANVLLGAYMVVGMGIPEGWNHILKAAGGYGALVLTYIIYR